MCTYISECTEIMYNVQPDIYRTTLYEYTQISDLSGILNGLYFLCKYQLCSRYEHVWEYFV